MELGLMQNGGMGKNGGLVLPRDGLVGCWLEKNGMIDSIGISGRAVKPKYHLLGDNTGYLSGTVAADVTVVSKEGTAAVTIPSANRINVGVGTLWSLLLSNGSRYELPTMTSATTAVMYDVSGNGRHLTLTGYTLATAVVESLTTGSDWLNQIGWTMHQNSLYPSLDLSAWAKGAVVNTLTHSAGVTTATFIAGTGTARIRPSSTATTIGLYSGYAKFRATNHRYVGVRLFCINPYIGTAPYLVVDTVWKKVVFAVATASNVAISWDDDNWFTLVYTYDNLTDSAKYFQIGLTDYLGNESIAATGNETLEVAGAGWVKDDWIHFYPAVSAAINATVPATANGVSALDGSSANTNAWSIKTLSKDISSWGDSHTMGNRWDLGIYPRLLAFNTPGRTVFNGGYGGQGGEYILSQMALYPEKYGDISVLWLCNNDIQDSGDAAIIQDNILFFIESAVEWVVGAGGQYVVLTLVPNNVRIIGTFGGDLITSVNNAIIATYPNNHIDIRTELQAYGDGSADDLADIANGLVPRSLRLAYDNVHHNHKGNSIVAGIVWDFINTNLSPLGLQKDYVGGAGRVKYSLLGVDGAYYWPSAPDIIAVTGVDNAVYNADGSGKTFTTQALALAALASLADDEYLFGGIKAAVLYLVSMLAKAAAIKRAVGDAA